MSKTAHTEIELRLHTDYSDHDLRKLIGKKLRLKKFTYEIVRQSLDARKKPNVYWLVRVRVFSGELKGAPYPGEPQIKIPYLRRNRKAIVLGSGPAGFFAAFVLQKAGFDVELFEKGTEVATRYRDIMRFEHGNEFKGHSNYCHGEGGAGTFSDGKLTSRTKGIAPEKKFVFETYVSAGAPEEILYLARPHIGSDKLRTVIPNLREQFLQIGGTIRFNTEITGLEISHGKCTAVTTPQGTYSCDLLMVAPGHSSYETYRMLYRNGVGFRTKPFAIGVRVEHPQELINLSQWLNPKLPGVKAAEYKLTYTASNGLPVYSFCMCPGGQVVPSAPSPHQNIVNGVSDYARNSPWANAAIVAGMDLSRHLGHEPSFEESLGWMENLEKSIYHLHENYDIPGLRINDFLNGRISNSIPPNSYPFQVFPYDFENLLPVGIITALKEGLRDFSKKIHGFETGLMMGLESKTSSPVQVLRDEYRRCVGFENLFIVGEGSGYAGGITSSAVDGVKAAMDIAASSV
ncbi:MAG: FAD-dependent protein [Bacteroidales bacterium]